MSDFVNSTNVKTRKPHNCHGCLREFPKGSEMRTSSGVTQGDFFYVHDCPTCSKLYDFTKHEDYYDGYEEGWVREWILNLDDTNTTPEQLLAQQQQSKQIKL